MLDDEVEKLFKDSNDCEHNKIYLMGIMSKKYLGYCIDCDKEVVSEFKDYKMTNKLYNDMWIIYEKNTR